MAQMGDESEDETPDNEEDDGKNFLLSDDGKDIDLRWRCTLALDRRTLSGIHRLSCIISHAPSVMHRYDQSCLRWVQTT